MRAIPVQTARSRLDLGAISEQSRRDLRRAQAKLAAELAIPYTNLLVASNWAAVFAAVSVSVAIACVGSAWTRPERAGLYRLVAASNVVLAAAIVALLGYCRFRCRAILARREGRSQRISASAARDDDALLRVCANCDTPFPPRYRPSATTHKFKCATCGLAAKRPKLKPREESSSPTNAAVSAISGSGVVRRAAAFSLTEAPAAAAASADRADPVVDAEKKDPTALKRATQRDEVRRIVDDGWAFWLAAWALGPAAKTRVVSYVPASRSKRRPPNTDVVVALSVQPGTTHASANMRAREVSRPSPPPRT